MRSRASEGVEGFLVSVEEGMGRWGEGWREGVWEEPFVVVEVEVGGWRNVEVEEDGGEAREGEGSRRFFWRPPRWLRRFLGSRSEITVPSTSIRGPPLPVSSMPLASISEDALELESLPSSPPR